MAEDKKAEPWLDVSADKYRFFQSEPSAPLQVFRHGGPWIEDIRLALLSMSGGGALMAALFELEALQKKEKAAADADETAI